MAKHRSLSNALLSPEKMAFIKGQESNQPDTTADVQPPIQSDAVVVPVVESTAGTSPKQPDIEPATRSSVWPSRPVQDNPISDTATAPANDDYLVAITTRLQVRTADALRRAHLEQKLNRREPATQQEIIELAVHQWLRQYGYLK
jgi:hypothetical protein